MKFERDDKKHFANKKKHGVGFEIADSFDWDGAVFVDDDAHNEERVLAYGHATDGRGYVIVFTFRGDNIRIISVRRFTAKENRTYGY